MKTWMPNPISIQRVDILYVSTLFLLHIKRNFNYAFCIWYVCQNKQVLVVTNGLISKYKDAMCVMLKKGNKFWQVIYIFGILQIS